MAPAWCDGRGGARRGLNPPLNSAEPRRCYLATGKFVHATDTIIGSHKTWHDDGTLVVFGQSVEAWRHSIDQVALARAGKFVSDTWKHKVDPHPVRTTACPLNKTDLP